MAAWIFKITALFFLFNAFLVSTKLPDGLFTTKELGFYLAVGVSCVFTALLCFKRKHRLKFKTVDLLGLGYLILIPLFHHLFFKSPIGTIAVHTAYGLTYFSIRMLASAVKPVQLVNVLAETLVLVYCFQLLIAIAQDSSLLPSYYPMFGATGMFFNPGPFAIFTSALLAFVYVLWLIKVIKKQYGWLMFYTLIIGVGLYFVILSFSRSAWLGLFIAMFLATLAILFINYEAFFRRNKVRLVVCAAFIVLTLIPLGIFLYSIKADSANGRILVWNATGLMINDSWDRGVGIGNFAPKYVHYQAAYLNKSTATIEKYGQIAGDSRYAFNDLLHTFAENGLIGVLLLLSIILYLFSISIHFIRLHNAKNWAVLLILGSMAPITVILVAGLTAYPLQMVPLSILFWFLVAIVVTVQPTMKAYTLKTVSTLVLGGVFIFCSGLYFYYFTAKTNAYVKWNNEEKQETKDIERLLSTYPLLNTYSHYLYSLGNEYMDKEEYEKAFVYLQRAAQYSPAKEFYYALGKCHEKQGNIQEAEKIYSIVQEAIPKLIKPYYLIAMMHYNNGDKRAFKAKAEYAIAFIPKIYNVEVMEMKQELKQLLLEIEL